MSKKQSPRMLVPLITVAAIALLWAGARLWLSPAPPTIEAPVEQATTAPEKPLKPGGLTWSTYHGGSALTGAVDTELPDKPAVLWRFQAGAPVYNTPVASGGSIFFASSKGVIHALDLDGQELWSKSVVREVTKEGTPVLARFDAPLACFESTLLAGATRGILYAFDTATGEERWTYDVGGPILGTANVKPAPDASTSARVFIIGQSDGALHCIDLGTGERVWKTESIDRCDGSPAVGDGTIAFGSCASALHIFSTTDGALLRNIELDADSQVAGGVAISGDSVFSGSHSGRLFHANTRTGEMVWTNEDSEDEIFTTPAVNETWVVFSSYDGGIYALQRRTGKLEWHFETEGLPTSPVIAADKVVVTSDGMLYLLQLKTGEELWSYEVSDEITSPAIIGNRIVVGGEDGAVTAFGKA